MSKVHTDYKRFEQSSLRNRQLLREEELILEVTETLSEVMEQEGISKTQLAQRLGRTKGFVSQLLAGGRNLTLRTIANIADALGYRVQLVLSRKSQWKQGKEQMFLGKSQIQGFHLPYSHWNRSPGWERSMTAMVSHVAQKEEEIEAAA